MPQTKIQMVDIRNQYAAIKSEVDEALLGVIESTAFINGPEVKAFATELAEYLSAAHVIPCGNGTDALQIALMALDLKQDDEVITTPFTFVATAEVIAPVGQTFRQFEQAGFSARLWAQIDGSNRT